MQRRYVSFTLTAVTCSAHTLHHVFTTATHSTIQNNKAGRHV